MYSSDVLDWLLNYNDSSLYIVCYYGDVFLSRIEKNYCKCRYKILCGETGIVIKEFDLGYTSTNVCEYIALVEAVKFCIESKIEPMIYTRNNTAIHWFIKQCSNSSLRYKEYTKISFDKLYDCDEYLDENDIEYANIEHLKAKTIYNKVKNYL